MNAKPRLIKLDGRPLSTLLAAGSPSAMANFGTIVYSENTTAHELTHVIQQSGHAKNRQIKIILQNQFQSLNDRAKLDHIFQMAKARNDILLFDEADALFGQRNDVGDARDRFANMETSYLLNAVTKHRACIYVVIRKSGKKPRVLRR